MSAAAKSVFAVGALLMGLGIAFALAPGVPAAVLGFAPEAGPVVRILGVVVAALGAYYLIASSREDGTLIRATVPVRAVAGTGLLLLVAFGTADLPVLAFVLLEYVGPHGHGSPRVVGRGRPEEERARSLESRRRVRGRARRAGQRAPENRRRGAFASSAAAIVRRIPNRGLDGVAGQGVPGLGLTRSAQRRDRAPGRAAAGSCPCRARR